MSIAGIFATLSGYSVVKSNQGVAPQERADVMRGHISMLILSYTQMPTSKDLEPFISLQVHVPAGAMAP